MTLLRKIGIWNDVSIEIAAWDGVEALVDLSCTCMFAHEIGDGGMRGGLQHLDEALGGAISRLRRPDAFRGDYLETMLLDRLPAAFPAREVLLIGLGEPASWTPKVSAMAAATAVRIATQQHATSSAFAPSLLDAGFDGSTISGVAQAMIQSVLDAIGTQAKVVESGLASAYRLRRWIFDVGAAHFDQTAEQFQLVLASSVRKA